MGTNKGKLKKAKQQHNSSAENRRRQIQAEAKAKAAEINDRAKLASPASDRELQQLAAQFSKQR